MNIKTILLALVMSAGIITLDTLVSRFLPISILGGLCGWTCATWSQQLINKNK